ncbi:MAG: DUF2975 domain-containing protein [Prevotellaceae bacterium]|jgi:hypothetical protein|nr:DUF2975 domain-containing protein [Prevotellaceae bacterium]
MKKFTLLGIASILIIVGEFAISFSSGWSDFSDGYKDGRTMAGNLHTDSTRQTVFTMPVYIEVRRTGAVSDSLVNLQTGEGVPYSIHEMESRIVPTTATTIGTFLTGIASLACLFGIYQLIRLLISISKRNVFTRRNIYRIRIFTYTMAAFRLLNIFTEWLCYRQAVHQLAPPAGYELKSFFYSDDLLSLVIIILFTELFAVSVKMKEEQDLTI